MFSVSFYIRRFAQRLLITEKEMKRESGGIFLNLIDLSVSCRFVVEKKGETFVEVPTFLVEQFCFCFFSSICSCFVHVGLHICHTLSIHIHTYANRERTQKKKHEFRVIYIIAEKNCTIFGGGFFRDVYQVGSSVCWGVWEPVSTGTTRRVGPTRCTAASLRRQ